MKKQIALLLSITMVASILASCSNTSEEIIASQSGSQSPSQSVTSQTSASTDENNSTEPRMFIDDTGREVEIPAEIKKVVVTGTLAQMMVFAVAPDMLVALSSEWNEVAEEFISEEYYTLPTIGNLYGTKGDLNLESLLSIAPDIIIDMGEPKKTIGEDMDTLQGKVNIPVVHITALLSTTNAAFVKLGELLGREEDSAVLAEYCKTTYDSTLSLMETVGESKKKMLYCLGDKGVNVIPEASFQAELLNLMADNIAVVENPSSKGMGNEVDMEQIMVWNPEVILFAQESVFDTVKEDASWMEIDAIKNDHYYEAPEGPYNWLGFPPSVQRYLGMLWLSELLYGEISTVNLQEEVTEYYELFYHTQLTQEQYDRLLINSIGKQNK